MRPAHLAALVLLSMIWGSAFMLVKVSLEEVPPFTLVAGRVAAASLFLTALLVGTGRRLPKTRRAWTTFAVLGLANNAWPFTLLTWGQQHIDSSLAAILVASMPLWTVLLAHVWIDERLTADRATGVLVGFAGVVLLIGGDLRAITESSTLGQLAMVVGAAGYATGAVFARRSTQDADPVVFALGQTCVGATLMAPVALIVERPFDLDVSAKIGLAWASLGVVATGAAYLIFFRLIRQITATQLSMVSYLIPITAVLLGALVLDERVGATTLAGLALIIAGVWFVNGGVLWLSRRLRHGHQPAGP